MDIIDKLKQIKKYRQWGSILEILNINRDYHNKVIYYCNNHMKHEQTNGINNDIDNKSTLPEALRIISKLNSLEHVYFVDDHKELKSYTIRINNYFPSGFIYQSINLLTEEFIRSINSILDNGHNVYVHLLVTEIKVDNNTNTIESTARYGIL